MDEEQDPRRWWPRHAANVAIIPRKEDPVAAAGLLKECGFTTRKLRRGWAYDVDEVDVALEVAQLYWSPLAQEIRGARFTTRRSGGFVGYACEEVDPFLDELREAALAAAEGEGR